MKPLLFASLVSLTVLASAAQAAPSGNCFRVSDLRGHTVANDRTVYFAARGKQVFRLDMANACLGGAAFSDPLVLERAGGTDRVCRPIDLDIRVQGSIGSSACLIKSITRMTPAEVEALPKRLRP
jgi:hypothetical protein